MVKIEEIEDRPWEKIAMQTLQKRGEIPMIIHQLVKTKNMTKFQDASCISWQRSHPGWYHILWTETDIMDYIAMNHPEFINVFNEFSLEIQRLEAFRYFVLHDYGGICTDTNYTPKTSLEDIVARGGDLILTFNSRTRTFSNSLMASAPNQELWKQIWQEMLHPKIPSWMNRGGFLGSSFKSGQAILNTVLARYPNPFSIFPLTTLETDPRLKTMRMTGEYLRERTYEPSLYTLLQPHKETIMLVFLCIILVTAIMFGRGVSKRLQKI
jgi:hypothetical protein